MLHVGIGIGRKAKEKQKKYYGKNNNKRNVQDTREIRRRNREDE